MILCTLNSLAEEVHAFLDINTVYLNFYSSAQDVCYSTKIIKHIKKQKPSETKQSSD